VRFDPLPDIPALVLGDEDRTVCVADLHLGIEAQLRRSGFNIPSQAPKMLAMLEELSTKGSHLLILGDVKHRIPSVGYHEDRVVRPFLESLAETYDDVTVVAGNHDGGLSSILPEGVIALPGKGAGTGDIGFCHGHVWPSPDAMRTTALLMGHIHPSVLLVDSLGSKTNEKCWVRARLKRKLVLDRYDSCPDEIVVVPAFNPLLTGTPVNARSGAMLGPVFRNDLVDLDTMTAYLLDGSNLGHPNRV